MFKSSVYAQVYIYAQVYFQAFIHIKLSYLVAKLIVFEENH